jgi:hypothetical protein
MGRSFPGSRRGGAEPPIHPSARVGGADETGDHLVVREEPIDALDLADRALDRIVKLASGRRLDSVVNIAPPAAAAHRIIQRSRLQHRSVTDQVRTCIQCK